jgi:predicted P-loop ATPase
MKKPHLPRYILCQYIPTSTGKTDKIPLNPITLNAHNPLDTIIHMTYEAARTLAGTLGDTYGVGYVFLKGDNYFFIDLDACINPDGTLTQLAQNTLTYFPNAYIEVSNSRRGLHIIGRFEGSAPFDGRRLDALGVEIYTHGRFCALAEINPQGDAQSLHTERLGQFIAALGIDTTTDTNQPKEWTTESDPKYNVPEDNAKLIEWFLNKPLSKDEAFGNILSIRHLWENNIEVLAKHFPTKKLGKEYDYSAADAALAYRLHYFTGGNCERVQELMSLSKLKRDKWETNPNYLPQTIINARGVKSNYFTHERSPQTLSDNSKSEQNAQYELSTKILQAQNYPELSTRGKVLDTSTNLKMLLDIYNISVRWNNMKREREVSIPKCQLFPEDEENFALSIIKDLALINEMPILRIDDHLNLLAQKHPFHPIAEGLQKNQWDGEPRLSDFINTIESETPEISYKLIKRWMISAVAAAHSIEGFSAQGVLVLAGQQRIGKTQFIKSLDPFNCGAVKSGALLDPTNKDNIRTLAGFWIAELGELDGTFRKADIARIKSYITEDLDKIRFPHMRKDSKLNRRTIFAATVNNPNFLVDETGNRRWWTIPVKSINLNHGLDMVQVWAEVYDLWEKGEKSWLSEDEFEELNELNTQHEQIDPLEELLHTFFDFSPGWEDKKLIKLQATDVLRKIGYDKPSKSDATRMGLLIKKNTGKIPVHRFHSLLLKA